MLPDWTAEDSNALDEKIIRERLQTWGMDPADATGIALMSRGFTVRSAAHAVGVSASGLEAVWQKYSARRNEIFSMGESRPIKRCAWCADTFRAVNNARFCTPVCCKENERENYKQRRRASGVKPRVQNLECKVCGEEFTGRFDRKYCGEECARQVARELERERRRAKAQKRATCRRNHPYEGIVRRDRRVCLVCERQRTRQYKSRGKLGSDTQTR